MTADFSQYDGGSVKDPIRFVLRVPVGESEVRQMMQRKDAEELLSQMAFVLGYKIDLES